MTLRGMVGTLTQQERSKCLSHMVCRTMRLMTMKILYDRLDI